MLDLLDPIIGYDLNLTCRTCLSYSIDLKSIFSDFSSIGTATDSDSFSSSITPLNEVIMSFTQVKIYKNDEMPYNICAICIEQAQTAYAYKKKCEESDLELRKYFTKFKIKEEVHYQHDDEDKNIDVSPVTCLDIEPLVTFNIDTVHDKKKKLKKSKKPKQSSRRNQSKKRSIINDDDDDSDNLTFSAKGTTKTNNEYSHDIKNDEELKQFLPQKPKEKTFVCEICSKAFERLEYLKRHKKVHIEVVTKFSCDLCKKEFTRKDNLKSHMLNHSHGKKVEGDKYLCVYCGSSFTTSSNLVVHIRRHTGEKPHKCDICEKAFHRKDDLKCHQRTHTGEKPCLCIICGKGFSRSNKLRRHMFIHTGERPFKCLYCERGFTQASDLSLHTRRHTGDKPYVCGVCGTRFIQGKALQTHRRIQGHYEEANQSTPFANISAKNPSQFTYAQRVNRIEIVKPEQTIVPLPNPSNLNT